MSDQECIEGKLMRLESKIERLEKKNVELKEHLDITKIYGNKVAIENIFLTKRLEAFEVFAKRSFELYKTLTASDTSFMGSDIDKLYSDLPFKKEE
jgi:hypothetical protein